MAFQHPLAKKNPAAAKSIEIAGRIKALEDEIAALRAAPRAVAQDYVLTDWDGAEAPLSSRFGGKDELIVVHNMGASCDYCTMWADGFNGIVPYVAERAAFVVASPDDIATQKAKAKKHGWSFRMVSAKDSRFFADLGFEDADGAPYPGVSTFRKTATGAIELLASAPFGPGDKFCAVFSFFDLLPQKESIAA
jgi:predicted dithiol-disulfide oxidoreductase (DUF899 family)